MADLKTPQIRSEFNAGVPPAVSQLAELGWKLFPRAARHRAAAYAGANRHASSDPAQLQQWALRYPGCGWCAQTGESGIWALDVDVPGPDRDADGVAALADLVRKHGPLPPRPMVRTGGGGLLLIFRHNGEPLIGRAAALGAGIDPKRGAHSITVPPTLHHRTGQPYRWIVSPLDVAPPTAPDWLLRRLRPPPEPTRGYEPPVNAEQDVHVLYRACDRIMTAREGGRNDALNRASWPVARAVAVGRLAEREAESVLVEAASRIGLPYREAVTTIRGAFRAARRAA